MRISTHAPARGATEGAKAYYNVAIISTHAPTGGATNFRSLYETGNFISIHAPTGGATVVAVCMSMLWIYFNPRSHGGSDVELMFYDEFIPISIHAPTGGATYFGCHHSTRNRFQSTLPRGERQMFGSVTARSEKFQSTLPRGERLLCKRAETACRMISIHAPTGGATNILHQIGQQEFDFNPRSHGGSDNTSSGFISICERNFNPRSHGGSDDVLRKL